MKNSTQFRSSIFIIVLSCFLQLAKAQIVYTNVDPDSSLVCYYGSSQCNLDIDKDGVDDFFVKVFTSPCGLGNPQNHYATCGVFNNNQILKANDYPAILILNDSIEPSSDWGSGGTLRSMTFCPSIKYSGNWLSSGFLGLKLVNGGATNYGWLHLGVTVGPGSANVTIFDVAFNSIPGKPLLVGQTCPPQSVIVANGPTTFCEGDSVILSSANTGTNLSYKWKKDGVNIPGATNKTYAVKTAGKYKVRVADNTNNCTATSTAVRVKVPCRAMNEETNETAALAAYPNPFSSSTSISFSLSQLENISLEIFDVRGRLIRTLANELMSAGTHVVPWNAREQNGNEVSEGIYFLRMQTESEVKTIAVSVVK